MYKVLLLSQDNDNRSFLSVTRSLGKHNIIIHTASYNKYSSTVCSRYIKKRYFLSEYSAHPEQCKNEIIELLKLENYTLVLPCDDLSAIPLQHHQNELEKHSIIYTLNSKAYDTVKNKHETTLLASSLEINVPKSILLEKQVHIKNIIDQFSYPIVLKPLSSFDEKSSERHNVIIIHDENTLKTELKLMLYNSPVQIQSYFDGTGMAVSLLSNNGETLIASQHKRVHEPFTGGGSSYRTSLPINDELLNAAKKMIKALKYTGVAMFEFKYNLSTKKWALLEINGRFWGSLPLAISAGIDYPYLLFLTLLNKPLPLHKIVYKPNIYQRNLESDMYWYSDAILNNSKEELLAHGYTYKKLALESIRLLTFRDKIDSFSLIDPCPFISEIKNIISHVLYIIFKKIRLRFFRNKFIRQQYKKKLLLKLSKAKSIVFVCKGNICRSPFAQLAAKKLWPSISEINSTGFYKNIKRSPPEIAIKSAFQLTIDLSNHRSTLIDIKQIKKSDLIFYFDEENRAELYKEFAIYKHKMYPLSLLSENFSVEIEDPIDKNESDFLETYQEIYDLIKNTTI